MSKRKYTKPAELTRQQYKEKFDNLFSKFNYIPQYDKGIEEKIVQCKAPYPDYWFISNMGYLFTVSGNKIKVLKPYGSYMGQRGKDGKRSQRDWFYYNNKTKKKVRMHKIMSDHFVKNEFKDWWEFKDEPEETHHEKNKSKFTLDQPQFCNRQSNLQDLPKAVHKEVTHYTNMTDEREQRELRKALKKMKNPTTIIIPGDLTEWVIHQLQYNFELGNHAYVISGNAEEGMSAHPIDSVSRA